MKRIDHVYACDACHHVQTKEHAGMPQGWTAYKFTFQPPKGQAMLQYAGGHLCEECTPESLNFPYKKMGQPPAI